MLIPPPGTATKYVPAGTPEEICEAINEAICKASEAASFVEGNKAMATFVAPVNYEETKAAFATEWDFLAALVEGLGLKVR